MDSNLLSVVDSRGIEKNILNGLTDFLSPGEIEDSRKMYRDRKIEFIVGRCLAKQMLARVVRKNPKTISLRRDRFGRPVFFAQTNEDKWQFSISHSHGIVGCAVASKGSIGLDLEAEDPLFDLESILKNYLSSEEICQLEKIENLAERRRRIIEFWCLREAAFKSGSRFLSTDFRQSNFKIDEENRVEANIDGLKFLLMTENIGGPVTMCLASSSAE